MVLERWQIITDTTHQMALKNGDLIARFHHLVAENTAKLVGNNSRLVIVLRFLSNNKFYSQKHKLQFDEALVAAVSFVIKQVIEILRGDDEYLELMNIIHTTYYILHTTYYILHTTYYILHTT